MKNFLTYFYKKHIIVAVVVILFTIPIISIFSLSTYAAGSATMTLVNRTSLNEDNLTGAQVRLTVAGGSDFVVDASLQASHFTTSVSGLTVSEYSRTDNSNVVVTLAYNNDDFDIDQTLSITIAEAAHTQAGTITTSNSLTVTHVVEPTANTNFRINISGSVGVSFVDGDGNTAATTSVIFNDYARSSSCGDASGVLAATEDGTGTPLQNISQRKIRITNSGGANGGWNLTVSAGNTTDLWESATDSAKQFDFNDTGGSGCTDGADTDSKGGQLSVDATASNSSLVANSGATTGITRQASQDSFEEGVTDSITLLEAGASSSDFGEWDLTSVDLSQKIPANQAAATDYTLPMVITLNVVGG